MATQKEPNLNSLRPEYQKTYPKLGHKIPINGGDHRSENSRICCRRRRSSGVRPAGGGAEGKEKGRALKEGSAMAVVVLGQGALSAIVEGRSLFCGSMAARCCRRWIAGCWRGCAMWGLSAEGQGVRWHSRELCAKEGQRRLEGRGGCAWCFRGGDSVGIYMLGFLFSGLEKGRDLIYGRKPMKGFRFRCGL